MNIFVSAPLGESSSFRNVGGAGGLGPPLAGGGGAEPGAEHL
jgi:hypothetical protein